MGPLKTLALTDSHYQILISAGGNLVLGGPTFEPLQSQNIGSALIAYILNMVDQQIIKGFFNNNIHYYDKQDFMHRATPSIDFYPQKDKYVGSFGWLTGGFVVKVSFPLASKRQLVFDTCQRLCNYLSLILNGTNCINFVRQYSLGCVSLAMDQEWDFSESIAAEGGTKLDIYVATAICKYEVSMLEYYEDQWAGETYLDATIKVIPG